MHTRSVVAVLLLTLFLCACGERSEVAPPATAPQPVEGAPTPPVRENFDGEPQLSLFPRLGAARPDGSDSIQAGVWVAYVDHLLRLSGVRDKAGRNDSRGWVLTGLQGVDSLGFFAPLAVRPGASYRVGFDFTGELPAGGSAGLGILEFDQFLWIAEQFPQQLLDKHQTAVHPGVQLTGNQEWSHHQFEFTVSPRGGMIHLILFRDGKMDSDHAVRFDNIVIEELPAAGR